MLNEKVVIVTGAGRGLGQAYAIEAARHGAKIVAADVLDCADTVQQIQAAGGVAIAVEADVTKMDTISNMAQSAIDSFGDIHVLVNNAALYGALTGGRFNQLDEEE